MSREPVSFASDNQAGAHPDVLAALAAAAAGDAGAYGADPWTERVGGLIREHFGERATGHLVFNGTGANVTALAAITSSHEAVICTDCAHLNVDECAAPERLAGVKLLPVAAPDGKLDPARIADWEPRRGDEHSVQPRVVSITQATELGTVYSVAEIAAIAATAHSLGMYVHLDGARLANAAVTLGASLRDLTTDAGVDVVSFGGTKNGLVFGDTVVFCNPELGGDFAYVRKQLGQLASKMRFASAQLEALLGPAELWRRNAAHANAMARRLAAAVSAIEGIEIVHPVEANAVFATLPRAAIVRLLESVDGEPPFYEWRPGVVRWMCSWATEPDAVDEFAASVRDVLDATGR